MRKLHPTVAGLIIGIFSVTVAAHAQDVTKHKKHSTHANPVVEDTRTVPPDPVAMQKWFSGAVDDILTNTDRTLNNIPGPRAE